MLTQTEQSKIFQAALKMNSNINQLRTRFKRNVISRQTLDASINEQKEKFKDFLKEVG